MNEKIDILLATYNGEKYLREQIESILHQTYKNIHLIISDDKSTDNTREILKEYEKYNNIDIYYQEKNLGYVKNFEFLLKKVENKYYMLSDQDDVWLKEKVEKSIDTLKKNDADLVFGDLEVVDENSAIELINDHYKKIDKSIYEKYKYDLNEVIDKKYKVRYKSIHGIFKSIKNGFNRILNYTVLKKILLLGFFASAMFIVYSVSNIAGATNIKESDYIKMDKNYLQVDMAKVNVDDYIKYENLDTIDYMIPGNGNVSFKIKMDTYYQLSNFSYELSGMLADIEKLNKEALIKGRMPQNEYEIVVDKKIIDNMLNSSYSTFAGMGIKTEDELLNKIVTIDGMKEFTIVGFSNTNTPTIYVNKNMFINILNHSQTSNSGMGIYFNTDQDKNTEINVKDYNLYLDDIKITKGRLPENDYETIVNKSNQDEMKLNKTIKTEVNGKQLTVVGYYDSKTNRQDYLVNNNTVKYDVISKNNGFMIYPKDKYSVINEFKNQYGLNIIDRYEKDKQDYIENKKGEIKSAVVFAGVILAVSLIEIYLMIRSSFLSRIKEIGILRAIGVKKKDVYRMFIGEIIAITTVASMPGIILMTYILSQISKVPYVDRMFVVNFQTVGMSIIIVYLFNIIVGLLPLFKVLRKTPAKILARHDVE